MISNIPAFTGQQDFQARHSDMLAAARRGTCPNRFEVFHSWFRIKFDDLTPIRNMIGIDMAKPGSDRTVIVTRLPKAEWRKLNDGKPYGD